MHYPVLFCQYEPYDILHVLLSPLEPEISIWSMSDPAACPNANLEWQSILKSSLCSGLVALLLVPCCSSKGQFHIQIFKMRPAVRLEKKEEKKLEVSLSLSL